VTSSTDTDGGQGPDYTTSMRTDRCGDLRSDDVGRQVTLCGWVARRREHGEHLAFVDLRDRSGIIQVVVDGAADLRSEYVLQVTGEEPVRSGNDRPTRPTILLQPAPSRSTPPRSPFSRPQSRHRSRLTNAPTSTRFSGCGTDTSTCAGPASRRTSR